VITGAVSGRRALVELYVRGASGQDRQVEFVLDTGFVGFLTMPPPVVAALGLPFAYRVPAELADGSRTIMEAYEGKVLWDGLEVEAEILKADGDALLGTSLLDGHEVRIEFAVGGFVTIETL
jgi:clan AA aspartic protease